MTPPPPPPGRLSGTPRAPTQPLRPRIEAAPPLSIEKLARAEATFNSALERSPEARDAFVTNACGDDAELQARVHQLLAAHDGAGGFLAGEPSLSPEIEEQLARLKPEEAGEQIGPYKLLQQIGEGGFGVVWMAEQTHPVQRRVALKIIKLGMDTKEVIARFSQERQALAMMDHPNIAKVLDAGATQYGRPYFVMELVRGVKITDYCDEEELSQEERIGLFISVCQAVQHAHQKGIIHRDLKPSNILVTINDGVAVPKVIDFGVAKATHGRLTEVTLFTQFEQMIGTPLYMSPEQAEMTSLDIDTRSDIYSLGVLLYELLTGRTPIDTETLRKAGRDEIRRLIREVDPPRPSARVKTFDGAELTTMAKRRHIDAAKLPASLRGDLDWIVMKCLEKDRKRRYETANGLALDLQRHLLNEVVTARPPTPTYLLGKLIRRNKLPFAVAAAAVLALLIGAVVSTFQAFRAKRAEAEMEAIHRFLVDDLLLQATPDKNAREKKVTMEEVLDRAARKLDQDKQILPEVEATVRVDIGSTYFQLGSMMEAERHLRKALNVRRRTLGPNHRDTLIAQVKLVELLVVGLKQYAEAEPLAFEAWQGLQKAFGKDNRMTLDALNMCAAVLAHLGKVEESMRLSLEYLERCERAFGPDDHDTIVAMVNLGMSEAQAWRYAEAERHAVEAQRRFERSGQGGNVDAFWNLTAVAFLRWARGDAQGAERLLAEAEASAAKIQGPKHSVTLHLGHLRSRVMAEEGKLKEAESLAKRILDLRREDLPGSESTARTMLVLGRMLVEQGEGRFKEAEPLLQEALGVFRGAYAMKPYLAAQVENCLGAIRLSENNYLEAEPLLVEKADILLAQAAEMSPRERRVALGRIVKLYEALGKSEEAEKWRRKMEQITQ